MSLSPFDIKGKGRIKTNTRFFSSWSDVHWSYQAPPKFMLNLQTYFSMKYMTLWPFLSPRTHTYIKDSSNWIYIEDSSTQPSGFTNLTQLPNQVGLQTWLSYPTKWVYNLTSPYMTEYYNFTSLVLTWPFHQITERNYTIKTKESQAWDQTTKNN